MTADTSPAGLPAERVLGVPISLVDMTKAVETIIGWAKSGRAHFVCIRDVHGVMRAREDSALMAIHQEAGMVTPDGMPLVWVPRLRGRQISRVCGADLVAALCEASVPAGVSHYFYGGKDGVAERMAAVLTERFPGLQVAGTGTPPFRPLTPEEDEAVVAEINASGAGVVWVGLSTPKQEYWMHGHVGRIKGATLIGVGAAFDFYVGDVKRAPEWMRPIGLEWLHRLASEPTRLWRRYLVMAPKFVIQVAGEELKRRFGKG